MGLAALLGGRSASPARRPLARAGLRRLPALVDSGVRDGRARHEQPSLRDPGPKLSLWPGAPLPLGASWDGKGTNFAIVSAHAEKVELCLFDEFGAERRLALGERSGSTWHGYLPDVAPGQRYGYRLSGPFAPHSGHLFNPAKLVVDPYARAIDGQVAYEAAWTLPFAPGTESLPDPRDDAAAIPKCIVCDPSFDWEGDEPPGTPWLRSVVYELHVKGFTMQRTDVRPDLRGTFAGLASDEAVSYLRSLGVTAVELLPIHHAADEGFLHRRGLTNYWGYSTLGFFAPDSRYAAGGSRGEQVAEFKGMVKALHRAGIEVILDVVYNHTAEGGPRGPVLSFRGIDNASYYRLDPGDPARYLDVTGTGNSLDPRSADVLRLVMDSLRYWVGECHVDGFRFDLATALTREGGEPDPGAAFLDLVHQDPLVSRVKLIAEPWDLGPGGYMLGGFPGGWREWNDRYRDTVRDFWRGRASLGEFASRLCGSSGEFGAPGRGPTASVNFVTCHDGLTLADLVSYEHKHNEANGEHNADGPSDNRSWNLGVEGPSDDPAIVELRLRQQRNFLATLLLSQGVPMLLAGDEIARSQSGNDNAWCQDNELSWLDWQLDPDAETQLGFTRALLALRASEPVFRRTRFLVDGPAGSRLPETSWFRPDGRKPSSHDWAEGSALGLFLNGEGIGEQSPRGETIDGDSFVLLVNRSEDALLFKLPSRRFGSHWRLELSTAEPHLRGAEFDASGRVELGPLSLLVLRREG